MQFRTPLTLMLGPLEDALAELLAKVDAQLKMARFRHASTRALRESENRFRALALASSDVVYRMSPDWAEMLHLEVDPAFLTLLLGEKRRR